MKPKIILLDDDAYLRDAVSQGLELEGFDVDCFADPELALATISKQSYVVLISDIMMPKMDGFEVLKRTMAIDQALPVILITGHGDVPLAVKAMKSGAYDFIEKPFPVQILAQVVERALEKRRLVLENRILRQELDVTDGDMAERIIGRSPGMQRLRHQVEALANTDVDVLVLGETGAGKEVIARALHDFGSRKDKPFVALNCAAIPKEIMESELFGHEQGAFTGAMKSRVGKLEFADGGTVFLDEIESMPLDLQAKLLRVIEERAIVRLGSNKTVHVDIRFVAATKQDLKDASDQGHFRADLHYRLNVAMLNLPPLRERKEDIPLLFNHLAREARAKFGRHLPDLTAQLEAQLMAHDWPGNVRELRNAADRFVLGLPTEFGEASMPGATDHESEVSQDLNTRLQIFEKQLIEQELHRNKGQMKQTYLGLGLSRKGLYDKIKRLGIRLEGLEKD